MTYFLLHPVPIVFATYTTSVVFQGRIEGTFLDASNADNLNNQTILNAVFHDCFFKYPGWGSSLHLQTTSVANQYYVLWAPVSLSLFVGQVKSSELYGRATGGMMTGILVRGIIMLTPDLLVPRTGSDINHIESTPLLNRRA
jgi:hypothetical protein